MPAPITFDVEVNLTNSKIHEIGRVRRVIGVFFLKIARWLLKSDLEITCDGERYVLK